MDTAQIVADYERDGFVFPIPVLDVDAVRDYRERLEHLERRYADDPTRLKCVRGYGQHGLRFIDEIVRQPRILEAVGAILGPDLLVFGCSMFIKEAHTPDYVSWHQDLTYWGLSDQAQVTAWLALSPATLESGCMQFVAGTHRSPIVEHKDSFARHNLLTRGQEIAVAVDEASAVDVVLAPGEVSLHHGHIFHASRPNRSDDRRIGVAIRYISPQMKQGEGGRSYARLVQGEDRYGHFRLNPAPTRDEPDASDFERMQAAMAANESVLYVDASQQGKRLNG
ncbi:MAG: phytanoyl-CoA dioxygenase family protein [Gammaproteobacteria bacterium]|nr:phytanoyl-CoA dioxygenase family protein [Gammaproteobacteria bacterium]